MSNSPENFLTESETKANLTATEPAIEVATEEVTASKIEIDTSQSDNWLDIIKERWSSLTTKQKLAAYTFIMGLGLGGSFLLGGAMNNEEKIANAISPIVEHEQTTTVDEYEKDYKNLSKEGKEFVDQFGSRYKDPISTFYSIKSYEDLHPKSSIILTDKAISEYDPHHMISGDKNMLEMSKYRLPINEDLSQEKTIEIFNDYTAKQLSIYMNLLAKNPGPEAKKIIDNEFMIYCSDTSWDHLPKMAFSVDNKRIEKLMHTASSIVDKYGSTANYEIAPAIQNNEDPNKTSYLSFKPDVSYEENLGEKIPIADGIVDLVIHIDTYNKKEILNQKETIKNVQLTIIRQPSFFKGNNGESDYNYISIGQEKISHEPK